MRARSTGCICKWGSLSPAGNRGPPCTRTLLVWLRLAGTRTNICFGPFINLRECHHIKSPACVPSCRWRQCATWIPKNATTRGFHIASWTEQGVYVCVCVCVGRWLCICCSQAQSDDFGGGERRADSCLALTLQRPFSSLKDSTCRPANREQKQSKASNCKRLIRLRAPSAAGPRDRKGGKRVSAKNGEEGSRSEIRT